MGAGLSSSLSLAALGHGGSNSRVAIHFQGSSQGPFSFNAICLCSLPITFVSEGERPWASSAGKARRKGHHFTFGHPCMYHFLLKPRVDDVSRYFLGEQTHFTLILWWTFLSCAHSTKIFYFTLYTLTVCLQQITLAHTACSFSVRSLLCSEFRRLHSLSADCWVSALQKNWIE